MHIKEVHRMGWLGFENHEWVQIKYFGVVVMVFGVNAVDLNSVRWTLV